MHKLVWLAVEQRLDLVVLYAIGDADGPLSGEVKIGISGRKAFAEELKTIRAYRSREVVTHLEFVIRGRARGLMLKTAVETYLKTRDRRVRGSWWRADGFEVFDACLDHARAAHIEVMSQDAACALEHEEFDKEVEARALGRGRL